MVQIDGKQDFVWPLGLAPGTYSVCMNEFGGAKATTTIEVTAAPLRVDLQWTK